MGHPDYQHDDFGVQQFVHDAVVADSVAAQSAQRPLSGAPAKGCSPSRSIAAMMRSRSGFAMRSSSLAALPLIRTE